MSQTLLQQPPAETRGAYLELEASATTAAAQIEMLSDEEAGRIIKRIRQAQEELASIGVSARKRKAQEVSDLRDYLDNFERLVRLKAYRASNISGRRKSVTTLDGAVGVETVKARCIVTDKGLALPWLEANHPKAVEKKIITDKLPDPIEGVDKQTGMRTWTAPGPGLRAEAEREELTINGKRLDVLLRGATEEGGDAAE